MKIIQWMRTQKKPLEVIFFFLDCFGSSVCGCIRFNDSKKGQKLFSNSCTISDRAFAILPLQKNWKTWVHHTLNVRTADENRRLLELGETVIDQEKEETDVILPEYANNKTNKKFQW